MKVFITGSQRLWDDVHWDGDIGTSTVREYWNRQVSADDTVYVLGEFSMGCYRRTMAFVRGLNGRRIVFLQNTVPNGEVHLEPKVNRVVTQTGGYVITATRLVYAKSGIRKKGYTGPLKYYNLCLSRYPLDCWWGMGDSTIHFNLYMRDIMPTPLENYRMFSLEAEVDRYGFYE